MSVIRIGTKIIDLRRAVGRGAGGGDAYGPEAFVTEWTVGAGDTIILPSYDATPAGYTMDYDVDWGDGSSDSNVTTADKTHTYSSAGTYQVVITNQFGSLNMYRGRAERGYLTKMVQWGTDNIWSSLWRMFYGCTNMLYEATDFPNLTNLVEQTDAREMFYNCSSITSLDISNWTNTSNITSLLSFFQGMDACTSLNASGLDLSSVTNFQKGVREVGTAVGEGCAIDLSDITWGALTSLSNTFYLTNALTLDLSGWDFTGNPNVDMYFAFYYTDFNAALDLSSWTNFSATRWFYAFRNSDFTSVNISGLDSSSVTTYYGMFFQCYDLEQVIGLNELSSAAVTGNGIQAMFQSCKKLSFTGTANNFSSAWGLGLGNCTSITSMFYENGRDLVSGGSPPNVGNWVLTSNKSLQNLFYFTKFSSPPAIESWDTSALIGIQWTFMYGCDWGSPYTLDLSAWNFTPAVTGWGSAFRQCVNLTSIEFDNANCNFSGVTDVNTMFYSSKQLETIRFTGAMDFSAVTNFQNFVNDVDALVTLDLGTDQDFSSVTNWNSFATNIANAPMSINWKNNADITATTQLSSLLTLSQLATADYDNLLIALDAKGNTNGNLHGGNSTYTAAPAAGGVARAALVTAGWTITDNGAA